MVDNTLKIGTILKGPSYSYKIQKVLGQGSFGITYLASVEIKGSLGTISSNTMVAVKEFFMKDINGRDGSVVTCGNKGGLYEDYKKKFAREAKNLSRLNHPNIIKVMDLFEDNNTAYYVMEYIDGGNLNEHIEKHNGLSESETGRYLKGIASALSYMHENKMLHLDLKPSNIMLRKNGETVLIDFGLSKQYDENGNPESSTSIGGGTPGYAPMEQSNYHEGKDFPVTMDIYALGATLFKMLTAVRPPEASVIFNETFPYDILKARKVKPEIIDIIAKAMSPAKKDRYQKVDSLISEYVNYFIEEDAHVDDKTKKDEDDEKTEVEINYDKKNKTIKNIRSILQTRHWFVNVMLLIALMVAIGVGIGTTVMLEGRNYFCLSLNLMMAVFLCLGIIGLMANKRFGFSIMLLSTTIGCLAMDWVFGDFDIAYINFMWYMSITAVLGLTFFVRKNKASAWSKLEKVNHARCKYIRIATVVLIVLTFFSQIIYPVSVSSKDSGLEWTRYDDIIDVYEANQDVSKKNKI